MHIQLKNPHFYLLLLADAVIFVVSLVLAYGMRFAFAYTPSIWADIVALLPWVLVVKIAVFIGFGMYVGMWRYTSVSDGLRLLRAAAIASMIIVTTMTLVNRLQGYPRSIFIADFLVTVLMSGGLRVGIRLYFSHWLPKRGKGSDPDGERTARDVRRVLVIGAGDAAVMLIREIQQNHRLPYEVVGCVDDDARKTGKTVLGVRICCSVEELRDCAKQYRAQELLIAMPSASSQDMRRVVLACEGSGLPFKTLPSLSYLVDGQVSVNELREVRYEDLLGRPPVQLEESLIGGYLEGKTVLITGAGGSIGGELCRQILRFNPAKLVLVEASEFNMYTIERELLACDHGAELFPVMGRVQDIEFMRRIFAAHTPEVVFHAAACKHVPLMEANPWEAVINNVWGSQTLFNLAEEFEVDRFVYISTDKAVRPTSVMGASKRLGEMLMQARGTGSTRYMAVRFGNVLGSSGSVIPQFQRQIEAGGPVTVTHPDITRFFMMLSEACQLVLQAGSMGEGGEIFVLEMGTPVKIADMARDMIRLSGKTPDMDIEIKFTGLRPGEKLYEELMTHEEGVLPTRHEKIMLLRPNDHPDDRERHEQALAARVRNLVDLAARFEGPAIREAFEQCVPEYTPSRETA